MYRFILLALLSASATFGAEPEDKPWPPSNISFVIGYCYDYIQDERGDPPVFPDGSLHKGVIHSANVRLSEEQTQRFLKIVSKETDGDDSSDCYYPHHAFVLYDEAKNPLGWVGICLGCGTQAFSSKNAPEFISNTEILKLCRELKLPILFDGDGQGSAYTELYKREFGIKSEPVQATIYSDYIIPITSNAVELIRLVVKRSDCSLLEFFQMAGINFPADSECSIESEANVLHLKTNHKAATRAVMILGHVMLELEGGQTPQQIAERYPDDKDDPFTADRPNQNKKENKSEQATPRKPSD